MGTNPTEVASAGESLLGDEASLTPSLTPSLTTSAGSSGTTTGTAIQTYWPSNGGFLGDPEEVTLGVGSQFSRYGGFVDENGAFQDFGNYVAPADVPFEMRSLPGSSLDRPYTTYQVLQPIPNVQSGLAAPAFGQFGLGTQYQLPMTIQDYIENGYIGITNQNIPSSP